MELRKFTHRIGSFTSATLISRILGYIRDALVAAYFGGGFVTDAFYAAFRVPNLLRRFMGEGSMTAAFIPVFTDVATKKGEKEANQFLNALMSGLLALLFLMVVLGVIFAPVVAKAVAWGFGDEKLKLTIELIRLVFPFLIVISLAALLTAILNSVGRFFVPALSPAGLSVGMIVFILLLSSKMASPIHGLAISVVVGGLIHFLVQIPSLYRAGFHLKLVTPFSHPQVRDFFILLLPTILGLCADQINAFVDQVCASFLRDGSVTALYNSNRIMQLPLALFGIAVSSVALPALSKSASLENKIEFKETLHFSLRMANYVLIPSTIGLLVLGYPIIQLLFEHGLFSAYYTKLTWKALWPYALGLPAYSAVRILATSFYAQKDTKTPVRIALWAMVLHVVGNLILMWKYEITGLAISTAVAGWFQAICLFIIIRRRIGPFGGRRLLTSFLSGSGIGLIMGLFCLGLDQYLLSSFSVYMRVPGVIGMGCVIYFSISKIFKLEEFAHLLDAVKKKKLPVSSK
ncbi:murein biosynthesis integral membrane protein MurJ [bacterium F11]|nr:murein biosynthesis integral membrane protein MurJ [bacterium F11]